MIQSEIVISNTGKQWSLRTIRDRSKKSLRPEDAWQHSAAPNKRGADTGATVPVRILPTIYEFEP
jgi:hypothetical protein